MSLFSALGPLTTDCSCFVLFFLLAVGCWGWSLVVGCLLAVGRWFLVACWLLVVVGCLLVVVCGLLLVGRCVVVCWSGFVLPWGGLARCRCFQPWSLIHRTQTTAARHPAGTVTTQSTHASIDGLLFPAGVGRPLQVHMPKNLGACSENYQHDLLGSGRDSW